MMKARKSAELLTLGIKMGLRQDTILRAREVFLKNESLVSFLERDSTKTRLHRTKLSIYSFPPLIFRLEIFNHSIFGKMDI